MHGAARTDVTPALERACTALRERALPVTVQRRALLEAFLGRTDHPTVDTLHADVGHTLAGLNRATVYRTLETLVELGLASRVAQPGAACRYDPCVERHHHLVCERCEAVEDVFRTELDGLRLPRPSSGFVARNFSVLFTGLCATCARLSARRTKTGNTTSSEQVRARASRARAS
jgi:Fur family peroxide stress response transcriptional regulator